MKVGDGLGWPGHHLAHPAHPRYAPAQGQQQQEKGKPVFRVRPLLRSVAFPGDYGRLHHIPATAHSPGDRISWNFGLHLRSAAPAHKAPGSARWR